MMCFAWMWRTAFSMSTTASAASRSVSPFCVMASKSSPPEHACITMYPNLLSSAESRMWQMLWWRLIFFMMEISLWKSFHSSCSLRRIALSARFFPVFLFLARWTVPKPPSPSGSLLMSHRFSKHLNLSSLDPMVVLPPQPIFDAARDRYGDSGGSASGAPAISGMSQEPTAKGLGCQFRLDSAEAKFFEAELETSTLNCADVRQSRASDRIDTRLHTVT